MLSQLQNTPKLEYLFVRQWPVEPAVLKLIRQSPINHLRLDPPITGSKNKYFQLPYEICEKSTVEKLTLALTGGWCGPEFLASDRKHFPALKALRLNLILMQDEARWYRDGSLYAALFRGWSCKNCCYPGQHRHPPSHFLERLATPQLKLLHVKFPTDCTGQMLLNVVSAAAKNCNLAYLEDLALAGGGFIPHCMECGGREKPLIEPTELRKAMKMLLPLNRLKSLRLSVAPNFLDVLDLDLYKEITDGLQDLETLELGHSEFTSYSEFRGTNYYERVPLHHLAAFCNMLPKLKSVGVGTIDGKLLEEHPRAGWACFHVRSLRISCYAGRGENGGISRDLLHLGLRTYFPCSNLAQTEFDPESWMFNTS
jgi:hypothetical protein